MNLNTGSSSNAPKPKAAIFGSAQLHTTDNNFNDYATVKADQARGGFKKIKKIVGHYHQKNVIGIGFVYELSSGHTITTTHGEPHKENFISGFVHSVSGKTPQTKVLDIDEGDYIETIQACYNDKKIIYLLFKTYKGSTVEYGFQRGPLFTAINKGYTFGPPKGSYDGKRLNYIVFPAATIPEDIFGGGEPVNMSARVQNSSSYVRPVSPIPQQPSIRRVESGVASSGPIPTPGSFYDSSAGSSFIGGPPLAMNPSQVAQNTSLVGQGSLKAPSLIPGPPQSHFSNPPSNITPSSQVNSGSGVYVGPVPPPNSLTKSQIAQMEMKNSRLSNDNQSSQFSYKPQSQQQQQLQIRGQLNRFQSMRLQRQDMEKNKQHQVLVGMQRQFDRLRSNPNADRFLTLRQQIRLEATQRLQAEKAKIQQMQAQQLKDLQGKHIHEAQSLKGSQVGGVSNRVEMMKRHLGELMEVDRRQQIEVDQRMQQCQMIENRNIQAIMQGFMARQSQAGSEPTLRRPVSANSLAPPGMMPIPQVIQHPQMDSSLPRPTQSSSLQANQASLLDMEFKEREPPSLKIMPDGPPTLKIMPDEPPSLKIVPDQPPLLQPPPTLTPPVSQPAQGYNPPLGYNQMQPNFSQPQIPQGPPPSLNSPSFGQPPPNLNQPPMYNQPPAFNQPPPGYQNPQFQQPPSNFGQPYQPPPNFGQPPQNFTQPPPNFNQPPPNFGQPNWGPPPPSWSQTQNGLDLQSPTLPPPKVYEY